MLSKARLEKSLHAKSRTKAKTSTFSLHLVKKLCQVKKLVKY